MEIKGIFLIVQVVYIASGICSVVDHAYACPSYQGLDPRDNSCINKTTVIEFSDEECKVWSESGYCMRASPFFDAVTSCTSCISVHVQPRIDNDVCSDPSCTKYIAVCDLYPELVKGMCEGLCDCGKEGISNADITSINVASNKAKPINNEECGLVSFTNPNYRIVGGMRTDPGNYPWTVSLRYGINEVTKHRCGGCLVNKQIVLSAAHCVIGNLSLYSGILGKHRKDLFDETEKHVTFSKIIKHPLFRRSTMQNDIAIFVMKEKISYTNYIRPVCMCNKYPRQDEEVVVTGWGSTKRNPPRPFELRQVTVPVIPQSECNGRRYRTYKKIKLGMFCAGLEEGGKDACQGDSGGPAVVMRSARYYLVGTVSWGYGCGGRRSPGVYTNICSFKTWIKAYMKKLNITA